MIENQDTLYSVLCDLRFYLRSSIYLHLSHASDEHHSYTPLISGESLYEEIEESKHYTTKNKAHDERKIFIIKFILK